MLEIPPKACCSVFFIKNHFGVLHRVHVYMLNISALCTLLTAISCTATFSPGVVSLIVRQKNIIREGAERTLYHVYTCTCTGHSSAADEAR